MASILSAFERGVLSVGDQDLMSPKRPPGPVFITAPEAAPDPVEPRLAEVPTSDRAPKALGVVAPVRRRRMVKLLLIAAPLLLLAYFAATLTQVWMAADYDETREVDAIVVLGAAQFDGRPSPVFAARLDRAFELWSDGFAPQIVTTGSNQRGDRFTEGFSGYVYLLERGVPDDALIPIVDGGDTWQQLSATSNQLEQRELASVLLVSDGYHSYRLLAIADEVGIEAFVSPTDVEPTVRDYLREAAAVSAGRIFGYRRISALNTADQ